MKKKILYLFTIFLIFVIAIAIKFFVLDSRTKEGTLKVMTSPITNVIVNDKPMGKTPFEKNMAEGEYVVKLVPETEGAEAVSWEGKVTIIKGALTYVDRELGSSDITSSGVTFNIKPSQDNQEKGTGSVEVRSDPDGSIVFLDNEEQGITPVVLASVPVGDHELSVFSPGFFRRSQKISVKEHFSIAAEFKLSIDPTHKEVEKTEKDPNATESAELKKEDEPKTSTTPSPTSSPDVKTIEISSTGTGWLRVRDAASSSGEEVARVDEGTTYEVLDEDNGWIKIEYETGSTGWVSGQYTKEL